MAIQEKQLGPNHPDLATTLDNLGALYRERGDYLQAEPLLQRGLAIREKWFGPEHRDVTISLNTLAILYTLKGDYARAEQLLNRALTIKEKVLGAGHQELAAPLINLATLYQEKKDYARAEQLLQRALALRERALGAEHPDVAAVLNNMAVLYWQRGDYALAEPLMRRSLAITEKAFGAEHPDTALALNNLASLYDVKGDLKTAESLYLRSLAVTEKSLGAQHPRTASLLQNLVTLYQEQGNRAGALALLARSAEINEHNLSLILTTGSEKQKLLYLATLATDTDYAVWFNMQKREDTEAARLALLTVLRRKGRALDAMSQQIGALRRRMNASDRTLLDQLDKTRTELASLVLEGAGAAQPAEHKAKVARLQAEVERLEAEVGARSSEFRAQSQAVTVERVQNAIPQNGALVEIALYRPFNNRARDSEEKWGSPRYAAYILKRDGQVAWVDLGDAALIDADIARFRSALADRKSPNVKGAARSLYEKVMLPVRRLLGDKTLLLVSPDGALNLVPFNALVDEQNRYLIESYSITYLTSGRDLLRMQVRAEGGSNKSAPLVIANPSFDQPGDANGTGAATGSPAEGGTQGSRAFDLRQVTFKPLPGTASEAQALGNILPDAQVLTGTRATEEAIKLARAPSILHIATHGFFLPDLNPAARSASNKRRGLSLSLAETLPSETAYGENPLLRSGLALAGVNQRRGGASNDGILTALEAAGLNLWGTKLVVLSACETGLGEVKNGDGVYGLRRALVLAGAESQLISLWQVSDKATENLMVSYYRRLQAGEGRAEALRQVQLEMLRSATWNHPYFWASFIPQGQWSGMNGPPQ
jgi:CHAT domain-containing protein